MQKLFLASTVKDPQTMPMFEGFVGGFAGKRIAYLPTAANGEGYGSWRESGSYALVQTLGVELDVVEIETNLNNDLISRIKNSDILWVAGGMTGYLAYWMRRAQLDKHMSEILDAGTIYVGSSAGSMVCSTNQSVSGWYIDEVEHGASVIPGLGLIDFQIYPHYREEQRPQIDELYNPDRDGKVYLLKDGSAITKVGDELKVLGEEIILQ